MVGNFGECWLLVALIYIKREEMLLGIDLDLCTLCLIVNICRYVFL